MAFWVCITNIWHDEYKTINYLFKDLGTEYGWRAGILCISWYEYIHNKYKINKNKEWGSIIERVQPNDSFLKYMRVVRDDLLWI